MSEIDKAVELLKRGDVVAFPTETVYGLGADATNAAAVRKIFQLKGRPSTNPLICHVVDADVAKKYARVWPDAAEKLTKKFWPGALTIVLPKTHDIVDEATAGLDTVGLRAPDHELTLELLRAFGKPLAGPSANKSSHVSPTTAQHVRDDFGDSTFILDGGPCRMGVESTVLDLSGAQPTILRPGLFSREAIEHCIGRVQVVSTLGDDSMPSKSPGQHHVHYAPKTPAYRIEYGQLNKVPSEGVGRILMGSGFHNSKGLVIFPNQPELVAKHFYAVLREMDADRFPAIYIEMPPDTPAWAALRDRITRATKPM